MSEPKSGQEPTMEEILASIRQIISDDAGSERVAPGAPVDDGEILELTEMMNEDGSITPIDAAPPAALEAEPIPEPPPLPKSSGARITISAATPDAEEPQADAADAAPSDAPPSAAQEVADAANPGTVVSDGAAGDVAQTLGSLASAVSGSRHVQLGGGGKTLEALVKELLRPMLKDWLDENLPPLVERLVEREIQRISGHADRE